MVRLTFGCRAPWLQDTVCTREGLLAGRAQGALEALLCSQRGYEADLCSRLRPALLQALQRLSMEDVGHGFGPGHAAQGEKPEDLLLWK